MHIPWEDLEVLVAVTEERSFSGAARRLALTQPTVSRRVGALEARLGEQLFHRDAEGARLTDAGAKLYPSARQMARFAQEATSLAAGETPLATTVRVGAAGALEMEIALGLAHAARRHLPEVTIELQNASSLTDLSTGAIDLLFAREDAESERASSLAHFEQKCRVFASKTYAKRWEKERAKGCTSDPEWISGEESEGKRVSLISSDHHLRVRAAESGWGALELPEAFADCLVPLEVPGHFPRPLRTQLLASRSSLLLGAVRSLARHFLQTLESLEHLEFSPGREVL